MVYCLNFCFWFEVIFSNFGTRWASFFQARLMVSENNDNEMEWIRFYKRIWGMLWIFFQLFFHPPFYSFRRFRETRKYQAIPEYIFFISFHKFCHCEKRQGAQKMIFMRSKYKLKIEYHKVKWIPLQFSLLSTTSSNEFFHS